MEADAALSPEDTNWVSLATQNGQKIREIQLNDLLEHEKDLAVYEKVSVIFLLFGSDKELINAGMQNIRYVLRNPMQTDTSFIYQWAKATENWQEPLIETLCIVQSYHVTEKLHLDMKSLEDVYLPYRCGTSLYINRFIKCLYLMMERMSQKETDSVITYMRERSSSNFGDVQNANQHLELYILDWISAGLLQVHDVSSPNIGLLFNFLKEFEVNEALEALAPIKTRQGNVQSETKIPVEIQSDSTNSIPQCTTTVNEVDRYKITRERCGWVLIINQKEFTKPDPSKIPPGVKIEEYLGDRVGTDADCEAIHRAFTARGYKIDQRNNLTHIQIQKALNDIVDASVIYDSLIVCILSHGNKGVVFGSDYIPVKVETIKEILSSERLLKKPKVLIIQACQGKEKIVKVTPESSVRTNTSRFETDGPIQQNSAPKYADLLTAMSTIEGFVSIRDRQVGTWYINELCKIIDAKGDDDHMLDILVTVNNHVSEKSHTENERELCMLPEFNVRLLKKIYLPKKIRS